MSDAAPSPITDPCLAFPQGMAVRPVPAAWSTNQTEGGDVCLWLRTEATCSSIIMTPDGAEHMARALMEGAKRGRQIAAERT